jgi:hypothetical protein
MVVKFIRKGIWYNRIKVGGNGEKRETFYVPHVGNGSKDSKWWSSSLVLHFPSSVFILVEMLLFF